MSADTQTSAHQQNILLMPSTPLLQWQSPGSLLRARLPQQHTGKHRPSKTFYRPQEYKLWAGTDGGCCFSEPQLSQQFHRGTGAWGTTPPAYRLKLWPLLLWGGYGSAHISEVTGDLELPKANLEMDWLIETFSEIFPISENCAIGGASGGHVGFNDYII